MSTRLATIDFRHMQSVPGGSLSSRSDRQRLEECRSKRRNGPAEASAPTLLMTSIGVLLRLLRARLATVNWADRGVI